MKSFTKYFALFLVMIALASSSCEKLSGGNGESITGAWQCREQNGNIYRQYAVSIDRAGTGFDTTFFVIYNFHNLGFDSETLVQLRDTIVTIKFTNGNYNASGKGIVSKDFKTIDWDYSISGQNVNDNYVIAHYFRP